MLKLRHKYKIVIFSVLIFLLIFVDFQKYKYPPKDEIQLKVNYLERIIKTPFAENSDLSVIGQQNCEWILFSLSFSTYALTNIAFLDTSFKEQSVELIDYAIKKVLTDTVYNCYLWQTNHDSLNIDSVGSILYLGHLNMMLDCYRLLSDDTKYNELNDKLSKILYDRFEKSEYMCLRSYSNSIWIPDNTVGLASLKLHSRITGSKYEQICEKWVDYAKINFIDEETGLLCSTISPQTGEKLEEPRGSMLGWSIFFIYRFDKSFAAEQYQRYKSEFSNNFLFFRLFHERYKNRETDYTGDIDSGPIIMGYSIPANVFAFGDAVALKDFYNAERLHRLIRLGSKKEIQNNEISYKIRFIDMKISPLAEALMLYFETMTDWGN